MTDSSSCEGDSLAYVFLVSSAGVFLLGLAVILLARIVTRIGASRYAATAARKDDRPTSVGALNKCGVCYLVKTKCQALVSGSTLVGRIMVGLATY